MIKYSLERRSDLSGLRSQFYYLDLKWFFHDCCELVAPLWGGFLKTNVTETAAWRKRASAKRFLVVLYVKLAISLWKFHFFLTLLNFVHLWTGVGIASLSSSSHTSHSFRSIPLDFTSASWLETRHCKLQRDGRPPLSFQRGDMVSLSDTPVPKSSAATSFEDLLATNSTTKLNTFQDVLETRSAGIPDCDAVRLLLHVVIDWGWR